MADTGTEDRVQKMEVDYSSTVDEKVPKCEKLAKVNIDLYTYVCCNIFKRGEFVDQFI